MCCVISAAILIGPRIALLVWWLINPLLFAYAFHHWFWPLLFALFAPFTMIFYLLAWHMSPGVAGMEWLLIGLGVILDLSSYGGSRYSRHR
ncbi:MAG: hypothetical protein PHN32_07930 [Actinomycetota bacterium]|jgi:hypothetical protein|nr:hypothetical protein [Actinomycetota bacterium]